MVWDACRLGVVGRQLLRLGERSNLGPVRILNRQWFARSPSVICAPALVRAATSVAAAKPPAPPTPPLPTPPARAAKDAEALQSRCSSLRRPTHATYCEVPARWPIISSTDCKFSHVQCSPLSSKNAANIFGEQRTIANIVRRC